MDAPARWLNRTAEALKRTSESLSGAAANRRAAEEFRLRQEADRRATDLRWLMSTPEGRRIVYRLMDQGHQWGSTYHSDQRITERMEGARDLVLRLADEISRADPDGWLRMLDEARNAKRA